MGVNVSMTPDDLDRWMPIRVHHGSGPHDLTVDWCRVDALPFTDPFFDQTVERALRHPFRALFRHRTTIDETRALVAERPGLPLAGFVFHLSRCGSTLVTQMLGTSPRVLALSEPAPIDTVLRATAQGVAIERRVEFVQAIVHALAQPRHPEHEVCVIKVDAWTVLDLALVRLAFPDVPWVFLHRDPVEVLVSQHGHRGFHMIRGGLPFSVFEGGDGSTHEQPNPVEPPLDPDEYGAFVLGRLLDAARTNLDDRGLVIDYDQLPGAVADALAPHFGLVLTKDERAAMALAGTRNAKNPVLEFDRIDDEPRRRGRADPEIEAASARWADGPWRALTSSATNDALPAKLTP